jgi:SAM-dependent methyltransferase
VGLFSPIIRKHLAKITAEITGDLLDVGCGDRPYQAVFTNVKFYVGIDRPSAVDVARSNNAKRRRAIDVAGSAEALPFCNECFDTVLATQLIEHIAHPGLFFAEATRVLKPHGCLIITFPLIGPLHEEPHDYFRYTEHGIEVFCRENELRIERVEKMGGGWLAIGYLIRDILYADASSSQNGLWARMLGFSGSLLYDISNILDRRDKHPEGTLNYLIVARKL